MRTYCSIRYIHQYCTGLTTFASLERWIGKCTIISKNDGGNILSNLQSVTIMSFSRYSNWSVFNTLEHNCLKKLHSSTITAHKHSYVELIELQVEGVVAWEHDNHDTSTQISFFYSLVHTERC